MSVEVQASPTARGRGSVVPIVTDLATDRPTGSSRVRDLAWVVPLLGFLGVVVPVLVARHYGALGIPRSDDWSYLLTLFRWVDSGDLTFNGWVSMTLVGQVAIAAPFAAVAERSITTIQLFTSMLGFVGLLSVVFIGRRVARPSWLAVFVAATIAVGPLWGPLAPTFMTDVPTFTFEMLTLAAAAVAFHRRPLSVPWFTLTVLIGFLGVSIRQYAVIPVAAIIFVAVAMLVADRDWRRLRVVGAIAVGFGIAVVALLYWWSGLPDSKSLSPTVPTAHLLSATLIRDAGFLRLAGLLLLPVVVVSGPVTLVRRAWDASRNLTTLLTAAMAVWLVAMYIRVPSSPFVGNYVARDGVLSDVVLAGNRPDVIPRELFDLLVVVGSISGIVMVLAAVPFLAGIPRRVRERNSAIKEPLVLMMVLTVAGFAAAYSLAIATGLPVYDRYALPILPLIAFLVLHAARLGERTVKVGRPRGAWAGVAIVVLAVLGLAYTVDSASFDGTRWKVAEATVRAGYEPAQIGGGFEWLGYHREHGPRFVGQTSEAQRFEENPFARPCVTITINPRHIDRPLVASATTSAFSRKSARIVAIRNQRPCIGADGKPTGQAAP